MKKRKSKNNTNANSKTVRRKTHLGSKVSNYNVKKGNKNRLLWSAIRGGGSLNSWPDNFPVYEKKKGNDEKLTNAVAKRGTVKQKKIEHTKRIAEKGRINSSSNESLEADNEKNKKRRIQKSFLS